jgi:hypothetical protein
MEVAVAAWPTRQIGNGAPSLSALVSRTHSANREIGTQTSVVHARARPQRQRRVERLVPRLPQTLAIFETRRELKAAPPCSAAMP